MADLLGRPVAVKGAGVLDGQVSKNLIIMFGRVTAFSHDGDDEQLCPGDSVRRRVDELLLDGRPLPRVACPRRIGERPDVKIPDAALAPGQLGFGLALTVSLTDKPVVFRAEALL